MKILCLLFHRWSKWSEPYQAIIFGRNPPRPTPIFFTDRQCLRCGKREIKDV